jgi:DNA mismatch repair protein MSH6
MSFLLCAGKSTLLRQVCLAALMAQVGSWVPADSLEMTPVDAIFVRMGARDAIMTGQACVTLPGP